MSDLLLSQIVSASLTVALSLAFGFLPLCLAKRCQVSFERGTERSSLTSSHKQCSEKPTTNLILSALLHFGGGVLLANCFCHWLPEAREGLRGLNSKLPVAEIIMCSGFFAICLLEEIIHFFFHDWTHNGKTCKKKAPNPKPVHVDETSSEAAKNSYDSIENDQEGSSVVEKHQVLLSGIRSFFVVSALSLHSVIEGLGLTLEKEVSGVWMNFGALALHKFVIATAVGIEMISATATVIVYTMSIVVFSVAPILGVLAGITLTESEEDGEAERHEKIKSHDFVIQILQAIATGTILYVVFFEIFPKARGLSSSGFLNVLAMISGFLIFVPSLLFHD